MPDTAPPIIALLTDFGLRDTYVGQMKAVILSINPRIQLLDLTHAVEPQQIGQGAFLLDRALPYLPKGCVVVAVVDPGVGTTRKAIAVEHAGRTFIGPDNGLLSPVIAGNNVGKIIEITQKQYQLEQQSATFHGRDLFSPAAAHVASGVPIEALGNAIVPGELTCLRPTSARPAEDGSGWIGEIIFSDHYGNLVTSLDASLMASGTQWHIQTGTISIPISNTYSDVGEGETLAYTGSFGTIEIAIRNANARTHLKLGPGVETRLIHRQRQ